MRLTLAITTAIATLGLAACGSSEPEDEPMDGAVADDMAYDADSQTMQARAMLVTAEGEDVGTVTATAESEGISISLDAMNMPAGEHGVHVHMTGLCEAPGFTSAGGHWNPAENQHGLENPEGQHAGDMPNLEIGEDGTGSLAYMLEGGAAFEELMDADGSAFVIHAGEDDQVTDPAGDSGDRIACGVFEAS